MRRDGDPALPFPGIIRGTAVSDPDATWDSTLTLLTRARAGDGCPVGQETSPTHPTSSRRSCSRRSRRSTASSIAAKARCAPTCARPS
jgi:hypothetical protein